MSEQIKIDKNVPIPRDISVRRRYYPFAEMEIGDSFFSDNKIQNVRGAIGSWTRYNKSKMKFSCITVEGGCRVWRVK